MCIGVHARTTTANAEVPGTLSPASANRINDVTCYTYRITDGNRNRSTYGQSKCGVKCSDNTFYGMKCDADIFKDGFDIDVVEP